MQFVDVCLKTVIRNIIGHPRGILAHRGTVTLSIHSKTMELSKLPLTFQKVMVPWDVVRLFIFHCPRYIIYLTHRNFYLGSEQVCNQPHGVIPRIVSEIIVTKMTINWIFYSIFKIKKKHIINIGIKHIQRLRVLSSMSLSNTIINLFPCHNML